MVSVSLHLTLSPTPRLTATGRSRAAICHFGKKRNKTKLVIGNPATILFSTLSRTIVDNLANRVLGN
jgi:hypothetical protein